eukprot:NODE_5739_length_1739_cov_8.095533.p1 GENE.NODE_5739_length_1739_cov_8.095533~~NODE_5739_length_1739_cov_8.095533.p1  ORF type:complete len:557 (-),score=156.45 NODE_5739_length_1739_cov_8.095533:68-1687(-)
MGTIYAWSVMSSPLQHELGMVVPSAADWSFADVTMPMSCILAMQGVTAALLAKWQMRVGVRHSMFAGSCCFSAGVLLGSFAIKIHSLSLLYLGYGMLTGVGVGLCYTPPIQALLEWFPTQRGLAAGMTVSGFGSGALMANPMLNMCLLKLHTLPTYVGTMETVTTVSKNGALFADVNGALAEVVNATSMDLAKLPYQGLSEGLYMVGSGNTGTSASLAVLGGTTFVTMIGSTFMIRQPLAVKASTSTVQAAPQVPSVPLDTVMRLPQFYLLSIMLVSIASGSIGFFSVAKPLMSEVFGGALPSLVTAGFSSQYLNALSWGNLGGRLGWAVISDKIGRYPTFTIFTLGSVPLYLALPSLVESAVTTQSALSVYVFSAATVTIISMFGGCFATMPAYQADLFGPKYVQAIHSRMVVTNSISSLGGARAYTYLRGQSEQTAIEDILKVVDPAHFERAFHSPLANAPELLAARTVTLPKLVQILPPGYVDPTPMLYNSTFYMFSGVMVIAAISCQLVRPVAKKHFEDFVEDGQKANEKGEEKK